MSTDRATNASIAGAAVAALAASSCCLGPLLLAALGVGGAGAIATLGAYRPYLLAGTFALLGAGFFFSYRGPRVAPTDACGCDKPRASRAGRVGLWVATVLVVLVAAAPPLLARWAEASQPSASARPGTVLAKATIRVEGIDCEACAAPMRATLAKVGGFHSLQLDIPRQTVTVTYEPAPDRLTAYVSAIAALGYEATPTTTSEAHR